MIPVHFDYLQALSDKKINSLEDALANKRLIKHLWIEFLLNSEAVKIVAGFIDDTDIKEALNEALSWYVAFRWLLPENTALQELKDKKALAPHRVTFSVYQQRKRNFLKGILYAGLC